MKLTVIKLESQVKENQIVHFPPLAIYTPSRHTTFFIVSKQSLKIHQSIKMAGPRLMKRVRKNTKNNNIRRQQHHHHSTSIIECLPRELLSELVAKVASDSFTDFMNLKLCSTQFLEITQDDYAYQNVSLHQFPLIRWLPNNTHKSYYHSSSFLNRCRECGNLDSLFREGMLQFFSFIQQEGFQTLKMAAQKGHKESMYVVAMINLFGNFQDNDGNKEEAMRFMRFLRKCKCVMKCRKRVRGCMRQIWMRNKNIVVGINNNKKFLCDYYGKCEKESSWRCKRGNWELDNDEDDDENSCENCRWDRERKFFYELLNVN